MTNIEFKNGLTSELSDLGLLVYNSIIKVGEQGVNTFIKFKEDVNTELKDYLQNRFTHGITVNLEKQNIILINTPNENNKKEFQKGDRKFFLDYEIIYCTNNDGIVLKHRSNSGYECHLGNYSTLDDAQKSAIMYFMIARPQEFATTIFFKIMRSKSGTMSEYSKFKNVCEKENIQMPSEITLIDSLNRMIGYKGEWITFEK